VHFPIDYVIIASEALSHPILAKASIDSRYEFYTKNTEEFHRLINTNQLVRLNKYNIIGSKTGFLDESGYCLATQIQNNGKKYIIITLGADTRDNSFEDNENLLNKPIGCVTAVTDKHEKTVMEYIHIAEHVFPVGRLDKHTSGVLLLTNDGDFANRMTHPRYETKKTYVVRVDDPLEDEHLRKISEGIELEDGKTRPVKITVMSKDTVELTLHEGRNRIVRRMFEHFGYQVKALRRIKVGPFDYGNLKPGQCMEIPQKKIDAIMKTKSV